MASPEGKRLMKEWGIDPSYVGVGNVILGYPAETLRDEKLPERISHCSTTERKLS